MDISEALRHIEDAESFQLPYYGTVPIWQPFGAAFPITRYMVIELIAAAIIILLFVPLAWRIRKGGPPRGRIWNFLETFLVFIRDEVARPAIGKHDADRFLPFIWTIFFFVLGCNLLGAVPGLASPTGGFAVTLVLAGMTFLTVILAGMRQFGVVKFWFSLVPRMDLPLPMMIVIWPMIFVIELMGMCIKHFILAVRLLANMFAGHLVLGVVLLFVVMTRDEHIVIWSGVTVASIFGATCLSLLELFVAFLQAYIFAFLSALFIGMAVHEH